MKKKLLELQDLSTNNHDLVPMINCAYYVREKKSFEKYSRKLLEKGFQILAHSGENSFEKDKDKLKVVIFKDSSEEQKIYIAFAGTYDKIDFWHSYKVIMQDKTYGYTIPKTTSLKKFITENQNIITPETKVILAGHSFGGLLSQYAALELNSRGIHNLECYNFSPLNTHKIISRLIKVHNNNSKQSKYFSGDHIISIEDAQFTNVVRPNDLIFSTGSHWGKVHHIPYRKQEERDGCFDIFKIKIIGDIRSHELESYLDLYHSEVPE
jgi:hypothetical protein